MDAQTCSVKRIKIRARDLSTVCAGMEVKVVDWSIQKEGKNFLKAPDIIGMVGSLFSNCDSSINIVSDDLLLSQCQGCVVSDNRQLT